MFRHFLQKNFDICKKIHDLMAIHCEWVFIVLREEVELTNRAAQKNLESITYLKVMYALAYLSSKQSLEMIKFSTINLVTEKK